MDRGKALIELFRKRLKKKKKKREFQVSARGKKIAKRGKKRVMEIFVVQCF